MKWWREILCFLSARTLTAAAELGIQWLGQKEIPEDFGNLAISWKHLKIGIF